MRTLFALLGLAVLGACSTAEINANLANTRSQIENLDLLESTSRAYDEAYRDFPFDTGAVSVIAEEHGELHTYSLTPCGVSRICGGTGHVGRVQQVEDFIVVTGAYPGRTFFLRPGGDGKIQWRGEFRDLAWN